MGFDDEKIREVKVWRGRESRQPKEVVEVAMPTGKRGGKIDTEIPLEFPTSDDFADKPMLNMKDHPDHTGTPSPPKVSHYVTPDANKPSEHAKESTKTPFVNTLYIQLSGAVRV